MKMTGIEGRARSAKMILKPAVHDLTNQILPSFRDPEEEMLFHIISDVHHGRHSVAEDYAFQDENKDETSRPKTSKDYRSTELSHRLQVQKSAVLRSRLWPIRKASKLESTSFDFSETPRRTCHNGIMNLNSLFVQGHAKLDGEAKMENGFPSLDVSFPSAEKPYTPRVLSSRPATARQILNRPQFRKVLSKSPTPTEKDHLPRISNGFKVQTFRLPRKDNSNSDEKEDSSSQHESEVKSINTSDAVSHIELKIYGSEILHNGSSS